MTHPQQVRTILFVIALMALTATASAIASETAEPKVSFKGLSAERIDLDQKTLQLKVKVEVNNPGPRFKLKDLRYRVKLNGEDAAGGKTERDVEIAGGSTTSLELPLAVRLKSLPSVSWAALIDGFRVKYEVQTEGTVPLFASLTHKLKAESSGEISLSDAIADWYARMKSRLTLH